MLGLGLGINKNRFLGSGEPVNTVKPLISNVTNPSVNPASVGDNLFVSDGTWVGALPIIFAYQWYRNGVAIVGATADTYTLVTADENKTIKAKVFATDNDGNVNSKFASNSFTVEGEPVNLTAPLVSGSAQRGSTLSVTDGTWIGIPTPTFTYQWYRGGSAIGGATNNTYVTVTADIDEQISCEVTADNGVGSPVTQASSNSITVTQVPINTVLPLLDFTGDKNVGVTITTDDGTWTGTSPITYTYQWKRNGSNISLATNSSYTLVTADLGATINCQVTATNAIGSANATSLNSVVAIQEPINLVAPLLDKSGNQNTGTVINCTTGTWSGYPVPTYAYQWKRNGSNIGSATSSSYTTTVTDIGTTITCDVTATNSEGSATQGSSNSVVGIQAPVNTVLPALSASGNQNVGTVITCGTGTWTGSATITYTYQWKRDGVNFVNASNSYTLLVGDVGSVITCSVTATNDFGSDSELTSNSVTVVAVSNMIWGTPSAQNWGTATSENWG